MASPNLPYSTASTQAGKSALVDSHAMNVGSIGVTGSSAANALAGKADVVLAIGTRLQDFTTGSNALIGGRVVAVNVQPHDLAKHRAQPVMADARAAIDAMAERMRKFKAGDGYQDETKRLKAEWDDAVDAACRSPGDGNRLPSDSEVVGAVNRACPADAIAVGAAGSMPGELHKLWRVGQAGGYHMEYGFSCMGYEVAAGIGVHMAAPDRPNVVFAGDGSYLMLNAELATAVMMGATMTLVVTDNRGYGCINRLQAATGGAPFNNMLADSHHATLPEIDFVAHAASMGARARKAGSIAELEAMVAEAIARDGVDVIVVDTDPGLSTEAGGAWWDVAVPEVSNRKEVAAAHSAYRAGRERRGG